MRDDQAKIPEDAEVDAEVNAAVDDGVDTEVDRDDDFDLDREDPTSHPAGPRRTSRRGGILGAAMLGFHQAMFGKQETETVVEIESSVADGSQSVILPQVTFGIAVRMAVMSILAAA